MMNHLAENILAELIKKDIVPVIDKIAFLNNLAILKQSMIAMSENYTNLVNKAVHDNDIDINQYIAEKIIGN